MLGGLWTAQRLDGTRGGGVSSFREAASKPTFTDRAIDKPGLLPGFLFARPKSLCVFERGGWRAICNCGLP
jgi:hypothetical protein